MSKVVLITGASSGIGRALAKIYSDHGAHTVLVARRKERIESLAAELSAAGNKSLAIVADVRSQESLEKAVTWAKSQFGHIDVVVANAGFGVAGPIDSLTVEDYQHQFETNVFGVLRTYYAARGALTESQGAFAVLGSVAGFVSLPGGSPYAMSKFAIKAFCDALYQELAPKGVSVTHIAPGFVDSEIRRVDNAGVFRQENQEPIPSWLILSTEKAAKQMFLAIEKRKREIIVTTHGKLITFIQRHFPGLLAFLIRRLKVSNRPPASSGASA